MSIAFHALCSFQEFQTQTDEETNFQRHFTNIKTLFTNGMEHMIPFQDTQVPDMLLGRILKKTEAEGITEPGTVPLFFENGSPISLPHNLHFFLQQ